MVVTNKKNYIPICMPGGEFPLRSVNVKNKIKIFNLYISADFGHSFLLLLLFL